MQCKQLLIKLQKASVLKCPNLLTHHCFHAPPPKLLKSHKPSVHSNKINIDSPTRHQFFGLSGKVAKIAFCTKQSVCLLLFYNDTCVHLVCSVFAECNKSIDLVSVEKNCRFDHCSSTTIVGACSSLEYAASVCKTIGICVDWRYLTNGSCGKRSLQCRSQSKMAVQTC